MSVRSTLSWWIAAIVLAAAAAWLLRRPEVVASGPQPVFTAGELPVDRIDEIRLVRGDEPEWVFRREGTAWRQVEPFEHPLESFSMRRHAVAAEALAASRAVELAELEADRGLASLGLEPPVAAIEFGWTDESGERHREVLELGRPTVAGRAWARRRGEERVLAVDTGLHDRIVEHHPREWRRKQLLDLPAGPVDRIRLQFADGQEVRAVREGKSWSLESPISTRLDREAVEAWLAALARVESAAFFEDEPTDLARYGLDAPAETLVLERASPRPDGGIELEREAIRLGGLFGPGSTDRFAMVEGRPVVVLLGEGARSTLLRPVTALIDPTGTAVPASEIAAVEIRTAAESFRIRRELDGFVAERLAGDGSVTQTVPVERARAESLLEKLTAARAPEIAVGGFPQELLEAMAILSGVGGRPLDAVRIARDPETSRWALDNGDDVMRVFPASFAPSLRGADYGLAPAPPEGTP